MGTVPDLAVELAGLVFPNPVILASGTVGYGEEFDGLIDFSRIGAISVKGTSLHPLEGNAPPRLHPTASGMLNAIGLQNVGVERFIAEKMDFLRRTGSHVIVNVFGFTMDEYVQVVQRLNDCDGIAAYELNVSCPNTEAGGMVFGNDHRAAGELTSRVRAVSDRPVFVKLSPNVTSIAEIASSVEAAGADGITVANTFLAMAIDTETFAPRLDNLTGGLSGPAIRPITIRMVYECAQAVRIPIVGAGGIAAGDDVVEYLLAGATAVQVGTAHFHDPGAGLRIVNELESYLRRKQISRLAGLTGAMKIHDE